MRAGHNALQAELERRELARRAGRIEAENRAAAKRIARLETDASIDRAAYAEIEAQLSELQGKLIEQQEEVAFYRGIVGGPGEGGLKVQDFGLTGAADGRINLRFVLAQSERAERDVSGKTQIRIEGTRAGRLVSLDASSLTGGGAAPLAFAFRYFQEMSVPLRLPPDFVAQRVVIRVQPATRGVRASVESFPWAVRG
jgi:hypothetical protein